MPQRRWIGVNPQLRLPGPEVGGDFMVADPLVPPAPRAASNGVREDLLRLRNRGLRLRPNAPSVQSGPGMKARSRGVTDVLHASRDSAMSKCQSTTSDEADRIARD